MTKDIEPEWYDEIIKSNPVLFKELNYFECSEGWKSLLKTTSIIIENYIKYSLPEELEGEVYATQVKSKFGGLRFYMSHHTPYIEGVIALAEKLSLSICEQCGEPSCNIKTSGWSETLCKKHYDQAHTNK